MNVEHFAAEAERLLDEMARTAEAFAQARPADGGESPEVSADAAAEACESLTMSLQPVLAAYHHAWSSLDEPTRRGHAPVRARVADAARRAAVAHRILTQRLEGEREAMIDRLVAIGRGAGAANAYRRAEPPIAYVASAAVESPASSSPLPSRS
jgi:hypothetical protein